MVEEKVPFHRERLNLPDNEKAREISEAKKKALRQDMAKVFGPPEGRRVLRYLMDIAGYQRMKVGGNPQLGMDVLQGSFYNVVREQVCIEFIEHIPVYIIKDVLFGTPTELEE